MDKAQRATLLRERFRAKGGQPFVGHGERKAKREPEPRKKVYMPWPDIIPNTKRAPGWFKVPLPAKPLTVAIKRAAKTSR